VRFATAVHVVTKRTMGVCEGDCYIYIDAELKIRSDGLIIMIDAPIQHVESNRHAAIENVSVERSLNILLRWAD